MEPRNKNVHPPDANGRAPNLSQHVRIDEGCPYGLYGWRTVSFRVFLAMFAEQSILTHSHEIYTFSCVDWYLATCGNNPNFEIFTPPYLLNADGSLATRPSILNAPSSVALGAIISVQTNSPCTKFALVRLGVVTHTVNNDLRRVPLAIVSENTATNTYTLQVPSNANVALPGYYWLYAMNSAGVSSEGTTVSVNSP
jgi:hypothetical protein